MRFVCMCVGLHGHRITQFIYIHTQYEGEDPGLASEFTLMCTQYVFVHVTCG